MFFKSNINNYTRTYNDGLIIKFRKNSLKKYLKMDETSE